MIISDLNYLEAVQENIQGGYDFGDSSYTSTKQKLQIKLKLISSVNVKGNFAGAEAGALAEGSNTSSQAITNTFTDNYTSASSATSTSATGNSYWY